MNFYSIVAFQHCVTPQKFSFFIISKCHLISDPASPCKPVMLDWKIDKVGHRSLNISAHKLLRFGIKSVLRILNKRMTESMNELMTNEVIKQPRLHWVVRYM